MKLKHGRTTGANNSLRNCDEIADTIDAFRRATANFVSKTFSTGPNSSAYIGRVTVSLLLSFVTRPQIVCTGAFALHKDTGQNRDQQIWTPNMNCGLELELLSSGWRAAGPLSIIVATVVGGFLGALVTFMVRCHCTERA